MTQNPNQFKQSVEKGQLDLHLNPNIIPCQIDTSETGTLVPGQKVKLIDSAGGVPKVVAITADTDEIFGVIPYIVKKSQFVAGDRVEIASEGSVIYLEASAAIARGAKVMPVITGQKVATATAGKTLVGYAFDKAAQDGDLIRVYLLNFQFNSVSGTAIDIGAILPTVNIPASSIGAADPANPTEAEVEAAIDVTIAAVESRLDDIETKLDASRSALQGAGLMA